MSNQRLFGMGVRLVRFAWAVEIIAVLIGFLISVLVAYATYFQINRTGTEFTFGDYAAILVAGLPFLLVAVVELTKIPVATAFMYAKHTSWRILFFFGMLLLAMITFETMINGFERNFANLTLAIDERKDKGMMIQNSIDTIEEQKQKIDVINPDYVEKVYLKQVTMANAGFIEQVRQNSHIVEKRLSDAKASGSLNRTKIEAEIEQLLSKESAIYAAWDKEREVLQGRLRELLNQNIENSATRRKTLEKELEALKAEMKHELDEASFLTYSSKEEKYRKLIAQKEARLYSVSTDTLGSKALGNQMQTEKQLHEQLQVLGENYKKRIDLIRKRIDDLNSRLGKETHSITALEKKYQQEMENFASKTRQKKNSVIKAANNEKQSQYNKYESIQQEIKTMDDEIYDLKKEQVSLFFDINRLVNQNQIYRVASYISGNENAVDVPRKMVGMVALVWFASLALICSLTGVFLAIAGLYIQKCYSTDYAVYTKH